MYLYLYTNMFACIGYDKKIGGKKIRKRNKSPANF